MKNNEQNLGFPSYTCTSDEEKEEQQIQQPLIH